MQYLSIIAVLMSVYNLCTCALTSQWESIPLSTCYRNCLDRYRNCNHYNDPSCVLLKDCSNNCYNYNQGNYFYNEGIKKEELKNNRRLFENKKREIIKRSCVGACEGVRDLCSTVSDSMLGVFQCNESNRLCKLQCY